MQTPGSGPGGKRPNAAAVHSIQKRNSIRVEWNDGRDHETRCPHSFDSFIGPFHASRAGGHLSSFGFGSGESSSWIKAELRHNQGIPSKPTVLWAVNSGRCFMHSVAIRSGLTMPFRRRSCGLRNATKLPFGMSGPGFCRSAGTGCATWPADNAMPPSRCGPSIICPALSWNRPPSLPMRNFGGGSERS